MAKSINRLLAELITATGEVDNSALGNLDLLDSADVLSIGGSSASGTAVYDTLDSLPTSNLSEGQQAFVNENQRLYISNGSGWYNLTLVNRTPTWLTEPDATYTIADSATPLIVTAKATDSDNSDVSLVNQSVVSDSAQYMVNISNDSSVWTFTPKSADSIGIEVAAGNLTDSNGDFVYTFKWSDGINFVSKASIISYSPTSTVLYDFTTHTFTAAGKTGNTGPSQSQFDTAYSSASWYNTNTFSSSNGIQIWTVPETATYRITADGAYGGTDTAVGGPARIQGEVDLTSGEEIYILVGQCGLPRLNDGGAGGGGGGTFVMRGSGTSDPLIIAGGGGGADGGPTGGNASTTVTAPADGDGVSSGSSNGSGGVNGTSSGGGGGGGLLGNGSAGNGGGGASYSNGGQGGSAGTGTSAHVGGFGGGGGSAGASAGGGGGGGYNGGKGGDGTGTSPDTAGGGSYTGTGVTNVTSSILPGYADPGSGSYDGAPDAGQVVITKL